MVVAFWEVVEGGRRIEGNAEAGRGLTLRSLTAVDLILLIFRDSFRGGVDPAV